MSCERRQTAPRGINTARALWALQGEQERVALRQTLGLKDQDSAGGARGWARHATRVPTGAIATSATRACAVRGSAEKRHGAGGKASASTCSAQYMHEAARAWCAGASGEESRWRLSAAPAGWAEHTLSHGSASGGAARINHGDVNGASAPSRMTQQVSQLRRWLR